MSDSGTPAQLRAEEHERSYMDGERGAWRKVLEAAVRALGPDAPGDADARVELEQARAVAVTLARMLDSNRARDCEHLADVLKAITEELDDRGVLDEDDEFSPFAASPEVRAHVEFTHLETKPGEPAASAPVDTLEGVVFAAPAMAAAAFQSVMHRAHVGSVFDAPPPDWKPETRLSDERIAALTKERGTERCAMARELRDLRARAAAFEVSDLAVSVATAAKEAAELRAAQLALRLGDLEATLDEYRESLRTELAARLPAAR